MDLANSVAEKGDFGDSSFNDHILYFTYPWLFNQYSGQSIFSEYLCLIMHHTAVIVRGSKRVDIKFAVFCKGIFFI